MKDTCTITIGIIDDMIMTTRKACKGHMYGYRRDNKCAFIFSLSQLGVASYECHVNVIKQDGNYLV